MPASSADSIAHIEGTLKESLKIRGTKSSLDQQLITSSKKVLMHKINFQPAQNKSAFQLDNLRAKYTPLNPSSSNQPKSQHLEHNGQQNGVQASANSMSRGQETTIHLNDGIPPPAVELYPATKVRLSWSAPRRIGTGLVNLGNTCFLNSTLQCLTYTPPLATYLLSNEHQNTCKVGGFCMLCELQRHIRRAIENNGAIRPAAILQKLKMIAKHMQWGRQEDAHEFLRYVIDAMQKSSLFGFNKLDKFSKETTVVNRIFGGFLRSQVLCLRCKERSNTYDPFMDISLDIKNVQSVEKAFEKFVHPETLDQDNAYNCTRCKQKVPAQKRFSIHRPPAVLTLQLKRFDFHRFPVGKVTKHISFPEKLNLRPFMSQRQGDLVLYNLYGVLVHIGGSCNSGHYYCYVKAPNQSWYCMNDASVQMTNVNRVLGTEAYLLFYVRKGVSPPQMTPNRPIIGPKLPASHTVTQASENKPNGTIGKSSSDVGAPVSRKPLATATLSSHSQEQNSSKPGPAPSTIPLLTQREKVSFEFGARKTDNKEKSSTKEAPCIKKSDDMPDKAASPTTSQDGGRIVLTIKRGKVYNGSLEDIRGVSTHNGGSTVRPGGLVPYQGESSSEDDGDNEKNMSSNNGNNKNENTIRNGKSCKVDDVSKVNNKVESAAYNRKANGRVNKSASDSEPVLDKRLNTTLTVPGAYKPLNQGSQPMPFKKEKGVDRFQDNKLNKDPKQSRYPSPVKRSLSDGGLPLTVSTNTGNHKVNATTPWHVLDQEAEVSPSIASSSGSVNSTSGWQVTDASERKTPLIPEAQFCGWTVTPVEDTSKKPPPEGGSEPDTPIQKNKKELTITLKKRTISTSSNGGSGDSSNYESGLKDSYKDSLSRERDFGDCLSVPKSESKSSVTSTLSSLSSLSHSTRDNSPDGDISESHLLNRDQSHSGSSKKHKQQKHQDRGDSASKHDGYSKEKGGSSKKHKKKKKHKKRKYEEEHSLLEKDTESPSKTKKRVSCHEDSESDSRSGEEIEWVEKTKETVEHELKKEKTDAPVQYWDQHVKDGYKRRHGDEDKSTMKSKSAWDGSRSSNVVSELEKHTARGYGAHVSSWDGGRSHVDQAVDKDRRSEKRSHWSDDYEEELDQGKTKKVKQQHHDHGRNDSSQNAFQRVQDYRNSDKKSGCWNSEGNSHGYHNKAGHYGMGGQSHHGNGHHRHYSGGSSNHHGSSHRDSHHNRDSYHSKHSSHYKHH